MIKTRWITNPFFLYIWSFSLVMLIYKLKWSNAYPDLSNSLMNFFYITFGVSFLLGLLINKIKIFELKKISIYSRNKKILIFIGIGYLAQFIYHKGIPFVQIFTSGGSYGKFEGIPMFSVLLTSFTIYYSVYVFHQYLSSKKKILLKYFFVLLFSIAGY